ncbi:hypothetical protein V9K67_07205 [Paraflavisolibacter sp. H34]|uniref:hypothetical protein n=1 Tax=Huijunlia imazamoxiresistens TaxID=3127457 RepID=UPI00301AD03D
MKVYTSRFLSILLLFSLAACKKDVRVPGFDAERQLPLERLSKPEQEVVKKFEQASCVLQGLFADQPLRQEFNAFIAAKLERTQSDEELTFREIFNARPVSLPGVRQDFLQRLKVAFVQAFLAGNYPGADKYKDLKFGSEDELAAFFDLEKVASPAFRVNATANTGYQTEGLGLPYMIYFPYSENFPSNNSRNYTICYDPLYTNDSNTGLVFHAGSGELLKEVTVDDDYAYEHPTYLLTYDDGLQHSDISSGLVPVKFSSYHKKFFNDDYRSDFFNDTDSEQEQETSTTACTTRLGVKDGRWTLLKNGYGLFEGGIDYAVAVSFGVSYVRIPGETPGANPELIIGGATAWGYQKIRRKKVKQMQKNENEYCSFGMNVAPWCAGKPDGLVFLYEYDRPKKFGQSTKEWSGFVSRAALLISDPVTRQKVMDLSNNGVPPLVTVSLEGNSNSKVEQITQISSDDVWINQQQPSPFTKPSLLNGYRVYGSDDVNVTLVIE